MTYICGTGTAVPSEVVTNAALMARVDTNEAWILSHTGIRERRRAAKDVDTSDLGAAATRAALAAQGWDPASLQLLICATSTPDTLIPATASWIGRKLGINPVSFDVNAACSGFVYGLAVATSLMKTAGYTRAALCTAEKYTRVTDYDDRNTCIFFGDSAATVLLAPDRPKVGFEIVDISMENANDGAEFVSTPIGGTFRQDGRRVKEYALRSFEKSARGMLARHGIGVGSLKAFCGHQANLRVLEEVAGRLGVSAAQHWYNVDTCGNQGAAGVITAFCTAADSRAAELKDGDLFLLTVFGSGFTYGSALLRRVDARG